MRMRTWGLLFVGVVASYLPFPAAAKDAPAKAGAQKGAAQKEFAGSAACQKCHPAEFKSWKDTFHSRIIRPREQGILKDAVAKWSSDGANPGPTTGNASGKSYAIADVKLVIGSRWKQRYLVANEDTGGLQFLNKQYNRNSGKWENYGQKNDWNTMCASCHTTGYRLTKYDPASPKDQMAEWSELSVGCEACHGPAAKHVASRKKKDVWNPANVPVKAQSLVCGRCHIRLENELYKSAQGNPREDLPVPKIGEAYKAGDDWTKWYPEQVVIPGVQPEDKLDVDYKGDLKGMFVLDEAAKANGVFEEAKHHQEYQGFIQSAHFAKGEMSCITCHSPHAGKGKLKKVPRDACKECHDPSFTVEKYMPNTGKTADNLFVRSHTFNKNPRPSSGPGATGTPEYYGD
jgi:cytochrome c553